MGIFGLGCGFAQSECSVPSTSSFTLTRSIASDDITIYILRGFQGLGPAASVPAAVSILFASPIHAILISLQLGILAHTFPPSPIRSIAFATFAAGAPVGAAVGSTIGGVLTQLTA